MNRRGLYYILVVVAVLMIITGGVVTLLDNIKKDSEETYKRMDDVNSEYKKFEELITAFEDGRENLYGNVLLKVTYDNIYTNNNLVTESLSNYESMVDTVYKSVLKLDKLCGDVYYPDSSVNTICNSYKTTYEQVNNYFVYDVDTYNKNVSDYNEYIKNINPDLKVKKYDTKKNYIDFDNDGEKVGKDEETEKTKNKD